jgi:hypothetical protein
LKLKISDEQFRQIFSTLKDYGFWGIFAIVFLIWGMPHVAPVIKALGETINERHKANLSHQRSMKKLSNKFNSDSDGKSG